MDDDGLADNDADGLTDADTVELADADGLTDADTVELADADGLTDADGLYRFIHRLTIAKNVNHSSLTRTNMNFILYLR